MILDKHTQEVIKDFKELGNQGKIIAKTIKIASDLSYLRGFEAGYNKAVVDQGRQKIEDMVDINLAYEGTN